MVVWLAVLEHTRTAELDASAARARANRVRAQQHADARRTRALRRLSDAWKAAESELIERGDIEGATALLKGGSFSVGSATAEVCRGAWEHCRDYQRREITPVRTRIEAWVSYARRVDELERNLASAGDRTGPTRYLLTRELLAAVQSPPHGCPSAVCSAERRQLVERQNRRLTTALRRGRRALHRLARVHRRSAARAMNVTLRQSGLPGSIRPTGPDATSLVWRGPSCSSRALESFRETLPLLESAGFIWAGCKSSWARIGWDLQPPALESQATAFKLLSAEGVSAPRGPPPSSSLAGRGPPTVLQLQPARPSGRIRGTWGRGCAENGSCFGDISPHTGWPKTVRVRGYRRRDGTYVRGHYRSRPR